MSGGFAAYQRILAGMQTCAGKRPWPVAGMGARWSVVLALLGLLALVLAPGAGADAGSRVAGPHGAESGMQVDARRAPAMDSRTAAEASDVAARMQYAYYTQDAQALRGALKQVESMDGSWNGLRDYHLAYGYWKLAEIYASGASSPRPAQGDRGVSAQPGRGASAQAARACVRYARLARSVASQRAEAAAVAAACSGLAAGAATCVRSKALREALAAAPDNPRVRLIEAGCQSFRSISGRGVSGRGVPGSAAALERWRAVVARFEVAPSPPPGQPDWGYVEALTYFGEANLQHGEFVAARNALERALVLMPDHQTAQSLLRAARVPLGATAPAAASPK